MNWKTLIFNIQYKRKIVGVLFIDFDVLTAEEYCFKKLKN